MAATWLELEEATLLELGVVAVLLALDVGVVVPVSVPVVALLSLLSVGPVTLDESVSESLPGVVAVSELELDDESELVLESTSDDEVEDSLEPV